MIRKKLAVIAAATLPLAGLAVFGGIQAASAGAGPILTCTTVAPSAGANGGITFNNGTTGISLAAEAGSAGELLVAITSSTTDFSQITINEPVVAGESLTVAGFTGSYIVASSAEAGPGVVSPNVVTLTTPLTGGVLSKGVYAKAKAAVTIAATDGSNGTVAYNPSVTEDVAETATDCVSGVNVTTGTTPAGLFYPTSVNVDGSSSVTNAAQGLENSPPAFDGTITIPPIGSGWSPLVPTAFGFDTLKSNTLNLSDFDLNYAKGAITGDFATTKGAMNLSAIAPMVVCSDGELQAIQSGTGPDAGTIAEHANPLVVCDSGTSPAYPSGDGLSEILGAELSPGATVLGGDGTDINSIYEIQAGGGGNLVL